MASSSAVAVAEPEKKVYSTHKVQKAEFIVDAVLFDMDGTLVDSIGAVEQAWGNVAKELKMDPQVVIDHTHGRRATDNLRDLKPELKETPEPEMQPHVKEFEEKILASADEYQQEVRSRRQSMAEEIVTSRRASRVESRRGSVVASPGGTPPSSHPPSRKGSFAAEVTKRLAFSGLAGGFSKTTPINDDSGNGSSPKSASPKGTEAVDENPFDDEDDSEDDEIDLDNLPVDTSDLTDRSVKILPGVRRMIDSIPEGRYAVATSGATTYCYGALSRVGITPPKVTITADDPRLKRGKPFPDPFILAATELGYDPKNCLVVEDSPSGIKAGVASGGKVIAVCTSHPVEKINNCGTSYIVPDLEYVTVEVLNNGRLRIMIDSDKEKHDATAAKSKARDDLAKKFEDLKVEGKSDA
ncbi:hydrolase-domain-containing protein [Cystobasidium minutum MCA 4210]|uniref:hydrolase-domain-containing protein n=1 Tax=Cystobasidium minutum MCA 4210 TaxID=1397322 RepID=UPI0034CEE888|eukprot:jgi/Rhomi1/147062/e_gw1.7.445.1